MRGHKAFCVRSQRMSLTAGEMQMQPQMNADEHRWREHYHAMHQGTARSLNGEELCLEDIIILSAFICVHLRLLPFLS